MVADISNDVGLYFNGCSEFIVFTGKKIKPYSFLTYKNKKMKKDTDYSIEYENNTKVGTATIKYTGKGEYEGTISISFNILPNASLIEDMNQSGGKYTITYYVPEEANGVVIYYSKNKSKGYTKLVASKKSSVSSSKLEKGMYILSNSIFTGKAAEKLLEEFNIL